MSLLTHSLVSQIAAYIKREFDRRYGPTWHVVVGKSASSLFRLPCLQLASTQYQLLDTDAAVTNAPRLRKLLHAWSAAVSLIHAKLRSCR